MKDWKEVWPERSTASGQVKRGLSQEEKTEVYIYKARQVHGDKYLYHKFLFTGTKEHTTIICQEHGEFDQTPGNHLYGKGCPRCSGTLKSNTEEFILKAKSVHGNDTYDYSLVNYTTVGDKVTIICKTHGTWDQAAGNHLSGQGCPKCANRALKTTEEFISQAKEVHGERYSYATSNYTGAASKLVITCSIHGDFEQAAKAHLSGQGCPGCARLITNRTPKTTEEFISQAKEVHGERYSYDRTMYTLAHNKLTITCATHGDFEQTANNHLRGKGCPRCAGKVYGHLYLLQYPALGSYKIGITNNVQKRLAELRSAAPCEVLLVNSWEVEDTYKVEQHLLNKYINKPALDERFAGHTELRILTNEEVAEICKYLETI